MRDAPRVALAVVLVGLVGAILGYWIIDHWHFSGEKAVGVGFVMAFLWVGVLSYWFARTGPR